MLILSNRTQTKVLLVERRKAIEINNLIKSKSEICFVIIQVKLAV